MTFMNRCFIKPLIFERCQNLQDDKFEREAFLLFSSTITIQFYSPIRVQLFCKFRTANQNRVLKCPIDDD